MCYNTAVDQISISCASVWRHIEGEVEDASSQHLFPCCTYRIRNITGRMQLRGVHRGNWKLQLSFNYSHFISEKPVAFWMRIHIGNRFSVSCPVVLRRKVSSFRSLLSRHAMQPNVDPVVICGGLGEGGKRITKGVVVVVYLTTLFQYLRLYRVFQKRWALS
jgi:hypothetical protein